jgi:nucleotide-binding universal stress UspA family protein
VDHLVDQRAEEIMHSPPDTPGGPELQEMLTYDLGEKARRFLPHREFTVRVLPASGRIDAHLLELAKDARAELIVVGTHQWRGLSRLRHASVSRRVLHASPVSVACVPTHRVLTSANAHLPEVRYVIAATDLSTHGSRCVPHAYRALQPGGAVCLLHVAQPGSAQEPLLEQLRALIPEEATRLGFHTDVKVIINRDAAAGICDAAERFGADLVCLGSHSRSPLAAAALGSVCHSVIARCKRPVLTVPSDLP